MIYTFEAFELDTDLYELRREGATLPVEPQVFDVLVYLVQHRDKVVSKEELLENVWETRFVTESALTSRIKAARRALRDDGRTQRLIGTVHGRGYRFLGSVRERGQRGTPDTHAGGRGVVSRERAGGELFVGRSDELALLRRWLEDALAGNRRTVLVTGEAGLGKTALIDAFLDEARRAHDLTVTTGRCLEHQGAGEPYMPILDALDRLSHDDMKDDLRGILETHAPTWLMEMPWLVRGNELEELRRRTVGSTRSRMLREIVRALAAIAERRPLVLVIDDLQWSDPSTLDVVSAVSRRPEDVRLLILCSCRTSEFSDPNHPTGAVMQELQLRGSCDELALPFLTSEQVKQYLGERLEGTSLPEGSALLVHERTEGNPLYMRAVVDGWLTQGLLIDGDDRGPALTDLSREIPTSLRRMIEQRLGRMSPRQQEVLETAAVVGGLADPWLIAVALDAPEEETELLCWDLSRTGWFLRAAASEGTDGASSALFGFVHSLYQDVVYTRAPAARRARLHSAVAQALETGYGTRSEDHAAELAFHCARGRDAQRAVAYLHMAGVQALRRYAYREAIGHLEEGLRLVGRLPEGEGSTFEIDLRDTLAVSLIMVEGWNHPDIERSLMRALDLCKALDDPLRQSLLLYDLAVVYENRGEHEKSEQLMDRRLQVEARTTDTTPLLESHELLACSTFHQGGFEESLRHAEEGWSLYDPERHLALIAATVGENLGLSCHAWAALDLWFLGHPDKARDRIALALELAGDPDHSYFLARAHEHAASVFHLRREAELTLQHATATIDLARQQGHEFRIATGSMLRGWARVALGASDDALAEMRAGLDGYVMSGARINLPYYMGLLADARLRAGRHSQSRDAVAEGLGAITTRGSCYEAELHRLDGVARIRQGEKKLGRESLFRALEIAGDQKALSLELRAATSIAIHTEDSRERKEARDLLSRVHARFKEGSKTPDLMHATKVLREF
jgi:DNA-binding winged helix-turn-helix (wHTH) protein/predicted ATPase/rhodanese-related sulfurtransferase